VLVLVVGVGAFIIRHQVTPDEVPAAAPPVGAMAASSLPNDVDAAGPLATGVAEIRIGQPVRQPVAVPDPSVAETPLVGGYPDDLAPEMNPAAVVITPAPTPMPTPVATPLPRPVKRPVPKPTPRATPTPVVAPVVPAHGAALPFEVRVKHRHRFGSCHGLLRIGEASLEYDSQDRDKDDRSWDYRDLRSVSFSKGGVLRFTEEKRDKLALGLKRHNYNFEVLDEGLPSPVLEHLKVMISSQTEEPAESEADSSG
jgi:hypothetical protein